MSKVMELRNVLETASEEAHLELEAASFSDEYLRMQYLADHIDSALAELPVFDKKTKDGQTIYDLRDCLWQALDIAVAINNTEVQFHIDSALEDCL